MSHKAPGPPMVLVSVRGGGGHAHTRRVRFVDQLCIIIINMYRVRDAIERVLELEGFFIRHNNYVKKHTSKQCYHIGVCVCVCVVLQA